MENRKTCKLVSKTNILLPLLEPSQCILSDHKMEVDGIIFRELRLVEENNLTSVEICAFQEAWDKHWNRSLGQQKEGRVPKGQQEEVGTKGFFKKLLCQKFDLLIKK